MEIVSAILLDQLKDLERLSSSSLKTWIKKVKMEVTKEKIMPAGKHLVSKVRLM